MPPAESYDGLCLYKAKQKNTKNSSTPNESCMLCVSSSQYEFLPTDRYW